MVQANKKGYMIPKEIREVDFDCFAVAPANIVPSSLLLESRGALLPLARKLAEHLQNTTTRCFGE
jgi:hypothetical protein